ncbi:hypothetical protein AB4Z39_26065 [Mycobacterium adipatum]|uniref:hypothetical protein n=1 Tax=Mycobacterium adipatum TaxID=1682113 RepID=UPI0034E09BED
MIATELLDQAQRIIREPWTAGLSSRMAAFLARQALEQIVNQRCANLDVPVGWASARSKLAVLRALDTPEAADAASIAWNRLSAACHVHAFELQPSVPEIDYLCGVVASLVP